MKIYKTALNIDEGDLRVSKQYENLSTTIGIQDKKTYLQIDVKVAATNHNIYLILSGGFESLEGASLDLLSKLMKHPEISRNSVEHSEGRNPMLDMLGKATGKRYTDDPDQAMAIPVLWGAYVKEYGNWTLYGAYKLKENAEKFISERPDDYYHSPKKVEKIPKAKRKQRIEQLYDSNYVLYTDITRKEKELMLNGDSEMVPSSIKVVTAPIYGVIGPIKNDPSLAIKRVLEIVKEIGNPMIESGELEFINIGSMNGKNKQFNESIENKQFTDTKSNYKQLLKRQLEAILYVANIALRDYPKCKAYLEDQVRYFYKINALASSSEANLLKPNNSDISNLLSDPDIAYWIDNYEIGRLLKATISMNDEELKKLEVLSRPTDGEYFKEHDSSYQQIKEITDKHNRESSKKVSIIISNGRMTIYKISSLKYKNVSTENDVGWMGEESGKNEVSIPVASEVNSNKQDEADPFKKMRSIKITFDNGDTQLTQINGTKKDILDYYFPHGKKNNPTDYDVNSPEKVRSVVKVDFLD